jgi:hypothetical protein
LLKILNFHIIYLFISQFSTIKFSGVKVMKIKVLYSALFILASSLCIFGQLTLPRESQRQEISQTVGDTKISIIYHRPNAKGRTIWGCQTADVIPKGGVTYPCLVPNGQVWRTGANEATVFEVSNDITVGGQKLSKGKYSLHTIPNGSEWTIIFNKTWNQWGSFSYDAKEDALRVNVKPTSSDFHETMAIEIEDVTANSAQIVIRWEKVAVPFTVDVGDVSGRLLTDVRRRMNAEPVQMANYILGQKLTANYEEALNWLDASIKTRETFANLQTKARLLAEMGRTQEAIAAGERAVQVGKAATPAVNTAAFEKVLTEWKTKK